VVVDGETGRLVDLDPGDPEDFERRFAEALDDVATDPGLASRLGHAGRVRAVEDFGWDAVARRTVAVYEEALR
jgi:starch synthase